ncbi:hypothetical protein FPY71_12215 [Aureimonas fodinaquatilis]|uniref:Uncharacterized protein n=1 Tax=Aureimonas fodinaquatilis TaxID=2565783 RepID=A0A5B0E0A2_9HYPH|nr:hypothetical protein [Aureimonas fodinaquatilis]KAA0971190.1 hypothetical protein FPY71_12215 [Aureimonas fodinaquatilis]
MASVVLHSAAPEHIPGFITPAGETDVLLVGSIIFLIVLLMVLGSTYFWLHSIPERIAHGTGKTQFQLVGVLALLALFTHNNLFWVLALLIAVIPIPDFWTPLSSMASSLSRMVPMRRRPGEQAVEGPPTEHGIVADVSPAEVEKTEGHPS